MEESSYKQPICQTAHQSVHLSKAVSPFPFRRKQYRLRATFPPLMSDCLCWGVTLEATVAGQWEGALCWCYPRRLEGLQIATWEGAAKGKKLPPPGSLMVPVIQHGGGGGGELLLVPVMTVLSAQLSKKCLKHCITTTMETLECIHWLKLIDPAGGCFNYSFLFLKKEHGLQRWMNLTINWFYKSRRIRETKTTTNTTENHLALLLNIAEEKQEEEVEGGEGKEEEERRKRRTHTTRECKVAVIAAATTIIKLDLVSFHERSAHRQMPRLSCCLRTSGGIPALAPPAENPRGIWVLFANRVSWFWAASCHPQHL